jgi:hypothetical protein
MLRPVGPPRTSCEDFRTTNSFAGLRSGHDCCPESMFVVLKLNIAIPITIVIALVACACRELTDALQRSGTVSLQGTLATSILPVPRGIYVRGLSQRQSISRTEQDVSSDCDDIFSSPTTDCIDSLDIGNRLHCFMPANGESVLLTRPTAGNRQDMNQLIKMNPTGIHSR